VQDSNTPGNTFTWDEDDRKSLQEALKENAADMLAARAEREAQLAAEQQDNTPAHAEDPEKSLETE
jgi:hypothetical protein